MPYEIGLATEDEIDRLVVGPIRQTLSVKDTLDRWRLVSVRERSELPGQAEALFTYLVGVGKKRGRMMCTSPVVALDAHRAWVITRSGSLYSLADQAEQTLPPELAMGLLLHFLR